MSCSLLLFLPSPAAVVLVVVVVVVSALRSPFSLCLFASLFLRLWLFSLLRARLPPRCQPPLWLSPAVAVFDRNSISTGPPLSPTFSPLLRDLRLLLLFYISRNPPQPLVVREILSTRESKPPAAFRAINYAAQLFTGISTGATV